ncbi:MAG: hypothetical protein A2Y41_09245 [Spirochaetes bacterium GWB1_36_13]|nr:MAG: hypothetical protein A2Y41_09245 [Spirochaetes bacterium GWB1_36_13]
MKIKFWGTTGSIPAPLQQNALKEKLLAALMETIDSPVKNKEDAEKIYHSLPSYVKNTYKGNSPCVEIQGLDDYFILDAGSGLRELGLDLIKRQEKKSIVHLFLSHFHWDHIMGFPFFVPAYNPSFSINVYSGHSDPELKLADQQVKHHFPVEMTDMASFKSFFQLSPEGFIQLNNVKIRILPLRHPGGSFSYRFDFPDGKSFVYATDGEYPSRELSEQKIQEYVRFYKDADLLVFDAMYTFQEAELHKMDWGHSSANIGVELAIEAGVKKLALFHHEPSNRDQAIYEKFINARKYRDSYCKNYRKENKLEIILALDGGIVELK